jgi:hypothetical protein
MTWIPDNIDEHYGTLLDGAMESIAGRLDALDHERDQARDELTSPASPGH